MKTPDRFGILVKELNRDPRLRRAVAKARRRAGPDVRKVQDATGILVFIMKIASRFTGKKKGRVIDEAMEMISLLVQVSILIKENVFDRPDVKRFFDEGSRRLYSAAEGFVAMVLPKPALPKPKARGARPTRAVRTV